MARGFSIRGNKTASRMFVRHKIGYTSFPYVPKQRQGATYALSRLGGGFSGAVDYGEE